MGMLVKGNLERTQEPTAANATSSRSHAILQVTVKQRSRVKSVMQEVRRNVTDVAYHIAQYSNIISELRDEIMRLRSKLTDQSNQRQSVANIQAVQSEVVESQRRSDRAELTHFKEQLLTSFKDQIELRRTLMELNNASMEISLETNRNQLVISEYEVDSARRIRNREQSTLTDNKYLEEEKENEAPEGDTGPVTEPVEVRVARDELQVLHEEKHKTERVKATIRRELDTAREKTSKLEEMIPVRISSADQQEILQLLCKVHQLEIASLEGQAAGLLRDFQLRHKDMVITRLQHWRSLADDIISRQRQMLEEHKVEKSAELVKLYELYADEQNSRRVKADDISSFSSIDKIASFSNLNNPSTSPKNSDDADHEDSNKIFTRSAKAKQIARAEESRRLQASDLDLRAAANGDGGDGLLEGGLALGLGSSSVSPARFAAAPSRISYEDRNVINANTRNIAALAARKRNQAGLVAPRPLYRPLDDDDFDDFGNLALTPSRLAQHNRYMEWGVAAGAAAGQFDDTGVESRLPPVRTIGTVGSRRLQEQEEARRHAVRYTGPVAVAGSGGGYLEKSRSQMRRQDQQRSQAGRGRGGGGRRKVSTSNHAVLRPGRVPDDASTVRSGTPNTISSEKARRTNNAHGGKGKRAAPVGYNSQWDKSSVSSTPQARERRSNVNKVLPTIPQYRKGDIAITGTATGATRF
ncbi:kinesin-like protein [Elysia marginata]|uniref:Kinesin-like protein n=1 Tax=Elysia marginata TaxID=1093978 RepID=A0AAV4EVL5_9GAST|nr:kinesin-like protein [Elysia marginata]